MLSHGALVNALIPKVVETERLRLRSFLLGDWRALHRHYSDPVCTKYTFRRALTEGESWRAMAGMAGHWELRGYGPYVLVEKESGAVAGAAGLWFPGDFPEAEIKWLLLPEFWGKGFAYEAVRKIQEVAFQYLAMQPISLILSGNEPSRRLASAVGATHERDIPFGDETWMAYRHPPRKSAP